MYNIISLNSGPPPPNNQPSALFTQGLFNTLWGV